MKPFEPVVPVGSADRMNCGTAKTPAAPGAVHANCTVMFGLGLTAWPRISTRLLGSTPLQCTLRGSLTSRVLVEDSSSQLKGPGRLIVAVKGPTESALLPPEPLVT